MSKAEAEAATSLTDLLPDEFRVTEETCEVPVAGEMREFPTPAVSKGTRPQTSTGRE